MGDTDKSPSLTRLLGVSIRLLVLPSFCLSVSPMTPSNKPRHNGVDDMLMLLRRADVLGGGGAAAAVNVVVAAGRTDDTNALQPWVVSIARSTRRGPW